FPPLGPDRRDSFFARTVEAADVPARRYVGVAAQGRSLKVVLLRTCRALLSAAQKLYDEAGGKRDQANVADAYMTLLGYFNSLRELGGSRRIVEDEVGPTVANYSERLRVGEAAGDFANRRIAKEPVELTSRVPTNKVAEAKRRLAREQREGDHVDVALATNMISVGLDITRLGLMVVLGQPKTSAEYIQATSRVGRDRDKPGLVVTLLNVHRPRDRSHYERFGFYHETFYRSVEASSVTPFSPRALDRALVGAVVSLARHGHAPMTPAAGASNVLGERGRLAYVVDALVRRATGHASLDAEEQARLGEKVRTRVEELLDAWNTIANDFHQSGGTLQYGAELGGAQRLLFEPLNPELRTMSTRRRLFRANRSMRDVEPSVNLWVKTLDNEEVAGTEDEE
ncbi:MAG: helicase, partial [Phycisphaerales bacterium]|nr:helicase [Phycisphaerales bacterium]